MCVQSTYLIGECLAGERSRRSRSIYRSHGAGFVFPLQQTERANKRPWLFSLGLGVNSGCVFYVAAQRQSRGRDEPNEVVALSSDVLIAASAIKIFHADETGGERRARSTCGARAG